MPPDTFKRLSELLRQRLLPVYQVSLTRALEYSVTVLEFIQVDKLIPALNAKDEPLKQLWEQLLTSLISGVLVSLNSGHQSSFSTDSRRRTISIKVQIVCYHMNSSIYLFKSTILVQSRESIASVFYPVLSRIYFSPSAMFLSEVNGGLLSAVSEYYILF